jgi:hypothetical protein
MNMKTAQTIILLLFFVGFLLMPLSVFAQPTEGNQSIDTLPEVTLPPPPELFGTTPQTEEDGTIVIPMDQIQQPEKSDIESTTTEGFKDMGDIDLDSIKPPPIPKELLEPETPPTTKPEIDINEPAQPMELPKAEEKPWFISWWFVTLLILFIGGIVIFLYNSTSSGGKKDNHFLSRNQKK